MKIRRRCKCGCGGKVSYGRKWINGHNSTIRIGKSNNWYKHGLRHHKLYTVWYGMKQRCYNTNNSRHKDYGGRGIRVCIKWRYNIKAFYNWAISHGWEEGLQIDRKDNNGNYHPNNCRFVTCEKNTNNRRIRRDNTTGYTGVYLNKEINKYLAQPTIDGKLVYLGCFNTAEEAAQAIKRKRR